MLSLALRQACCDVKPAIFLIQRRTFLPRVKTSEKSFRRKDNVDENFSVIYKAPMEYYLRACNYATTIAASVFGGFALYKLVHRDEEVSKEQKEVEYLGGMATMSDEEYSYFALSLVAFCIMVRMIIYKYPLRIYRNQMKYIAVFEGHLPLSKIKLNFEKGSVKELPPTGIMPWRDYRYLINDRSTIMYEEYFRTPYELYNMMEAPKKAK